MRVGVWIGLVAAVAYSVCTLLQAAGARRAAYGETSAPTLFMLLREPRWLIGVACLPLAFLGFVLSAQSLPLPVAEAIRASYLVIVVLLGHAVFHTRPRSTELVGVALAMTGLMLFVGASSRRGDGQPGSLLWLYMAAVVGTVVIGGAVVQRSGFPLGPRGAVDAVLGGCAFAVLDAAVRTLPEELRPIPILTLPSVWVGAVGGAVGLVLLARALAETSLAVANTLLLLVNVSLASTWAVLALGDTFDAGAGYMLVCGTLIAVGISVVMFQAPDRRVPVGAEIGDVPASRSRDASPHE